MSNPFTTGVPVMGASFAGRGAELRRVRSRCESQGQATAVVGEPGIGKTSLLQELGRLLMVEGESVRLVGCYLDAHTLPADLGAHDFWERALVVFEGLPLPEAVAQALVAVREQAFAPFRLERFFTLLDQARWRLVLVVDEFEALLYNEALGLSGFFGSLRSLASRFAGLSLVLSSHSSVDRMHDRSRGFHFGSPILNFVDELTLGPLEDADVNGLLDRAEGRFEAADQAFVLRVSGGYPLLVQAVSAELFDLAVQSPELPAVVRRTQAGLRLRDVAGRTLNANWTTWTPAHRRAFAVVALANLNALRTGELAATRFDVAALREDLDVLGPEVRELRRRGILDEDVLLPGQLRVRADALLWWFADKAVELSRPEVAFEDWLAEHQLDGVWRKDEQERVQQALTAAVGLLSLGTRALVEGAAKGLGAAVVTGLP